VQSTVACAPVKAKPVDARWSNFAPIQLFMLWQFSQVVGKPLAKWLGCAD